MIVALPVFAAAGCVAFAAARLFAIGVDALAFVAPVQGVASAVVAVAVEFASVVVVSGVI